MANLRMVLVDVECETPAEATSILRSALHGGVEELQETVEVAVIEKPKKDEPEESSARIGRAPAEADDGSIRGAILGALKRAPLSSGELMHKTGLEMNQVAPCCSKLKTSGRIMSKLDEADGTRRWYFVK